MAASVATPSAIAASAAACFDRPPTQPSASTSTLTPAVKALLIVPLVFLVTACLVVEGGPVRTIVETVRRYWRAWATLTVVSLGYLGIYVWRTSLGSPGLHNPVSAGQRVTFFDHLVRSTVVPGLLGGPWRWLDTGDGPPLTLPTGLSRWLASAVFAGLISTQALFP